MKSALPGGGVIIDDYRAGPFDLTLNTQSDLRHNIFGFLYDLHHAVFKMSGEELFGKYALALLHGEAFAGSTKEFMQTNNFQQIYGKDGINDVDVMVPKEQLKPDSALLKVLIPGAVFGVYEVLGTKKIGTQLHALVKHRLYEDIHQFDFEAADYVDDAPSAWNQLATNSHPADMLLGLKGVHHKLLLNAAVKAAWSVLGVHLINRGTKVKSRGEHPLNTFAVSSGLRRSYVYTNKEYEDERVLKKLGPKDKPKYHTDPEAIAQMTFCGHNAEIDSFMGVIRSANKYFGRTQRERMLRYYKDIIHRVGDKEPEATKRSLKILEDKLCL